MSGSVCPADMPCHCACCQSITNHLRTSAVAAGFRHRDAARIWVRGESFRGGHPAHAYVYVDGVQIARLEEKGVLPRDVVDDVLRRLRSITC